MGRHVPTFAISTEGKESTEGNVHSTVLRIDRHDREMSVKDTDDIEWSLEGRIESNGLL